MQAPPSNASLERSPPGYWQPPSASWWTGLLVLGALIGLGLLGFAILYFPGPK